MSLSYQKKDWRAGHYCITVTKIKITPGPQHQSVKLTLWSYSWPGAYLLITHTAMSTGYINLMSDCEIQFNHMQNFVDYMQYLSQGGFFFSDNHGGYQHLSFSTFVAQ